LIGRGWPGPTLREPARRPERDHVSTPPGISGTRLLVTAPESGGDDCAGRRHAQGAVRTIATGAPGMEGGIAVAPASFGRPTAATSSPPMRRGVAGSSPIAPDGTVATLAVIRPAARRRHRRRERRLRATGIQRHRCRLSGRPVLEGQPAPGHGQHPCALPGNGNWSRRGVHPGDLLVATEGSAQTIVRALRQFLHGEIHRHWPPP